MGDEEVRVEVTQVHLGDQVVVANGLLNRMQPLHFEMLVLNAAVDLWHGQESRPKSVGGLQWQLLDRANLDVVLHSCRARPSFLAANLVPSFRLERVA